MECACLMVSSLLRYLCWRWWFFRFNYQLSFKRLFAKKTDSFWSFSFESLEIPNLLIWILSSTRKDSKVFINSISKLVSLTCSFWSAKLDVLVCVTLLFCMGLRKCFFFNCIFLLGIFFFRHVVKSCNPDSHWRRANEEEFSSFFNISSLWENHRFPFSAVSLTLRNKNCE